jgi:hypothetical protein
MDQFNPPPLVAVVEDDAPSRTATIASLANH